MTNPKKYFNTQKGQSMILLVFFVMTAVAITIAAIFMMIITSGSVADMQNGIEAGQLADSGAENALLKLERDPSYSGEVYTLGNATVTVIVTGGTTKTINSTVVSGDFTRKVEVLANYTNNVLSVTSWKEQF
ncbi:hypothetical protein A2210_03335 [Candidatus Woesebacteria bacterium RIFOXYA1_FULL_40_18]|uniref:Type 4 fimbrial biogenesis protein PilX N-terminal domain-containing protein n=5 Tax=Candidatus Woeseibacteriota TaxID=1752722 RepID=A0A1F8CN95_9BACT|nr:MAG: hypothetical protein A2210_03335 [Candidatus Woesebacteria bacterium RIFOXYA1_FULL_40_18]OGM79864.1 MAG: hypothetical protein A2361_02120 [Candidatus Woesebacteria bacterium RIFOXYB1_FULL_40_26]OGM88208.1 MAG: hypothetical protein A2614_01230 [Candidatus Woesebacteria bacterium RIFOXYD1_FULL_40_21]